MTRKERFKEVYKSKKFKSIVHLMIAVESIIEGDKDKGYQKAVNNKNYSNMISESNGKQFSLKYVEALEKVLEMRYIDMFYDNEDKQRTILEYDSLRTVAYANDYERTKEFALKTAYNESILYNEDEFEKTFLDYVLEYSSINCLKYLVDNENVKFEPNGFFNNYSRGFRSTENETLAWRVANLIYEYDDVELFNKLFDPKDAIYFTIVQHSKIYQDEMFARGVLRTKKILSELLEIVPYDLDILTCKQVFNPLGIGKFANALLSTVLNVAMKEPLKYEEQLNEMLPKIYFNNIKIYENAYNLEPLIVVDGDGLIHFQEVYGKMVLYNEPLDSNTPDEIKKWILMLDKPIKEKKKD